LLNYASKYRLLKSEQFNRTSDGYAIVSFRLKKH